MKSKTIQDNPGVFQNPQVLVVGAGPSGLILCHELLRRGIKCRLIEKKSHPSGSTRAFTLHARTMEMFDHMGLASRIDELREVCPGNRFHFPELSSVQINRPFSILEDFLGPDITTMARSIKMILTAHYVNL